MTSGELGARHPQVKRLRALNRDRQARAAEQAFVLEGPLLVAAALDRGVPLEAVYLGPAARAAFAPLVARRIERAVPVHDLREGVLEKVGVTRTPQPVLGVAPLHVGTLEDLPPGADVLVAVDVSDPGNLGTMVRSAEAAGAGAVVVCGDSVDAHNPKAVRSSAGAVLGVPVVPARDTSAALDALHRAGRRCVAAAAHGGGSLDALSHPGPVALVVGNEVRGLHADLGDRLDAVVTIPLHGPAESLNVAMAATVLLFERDRRTEAPA